jgi:hypothetical protein
MSHPDSAMLPFRALHNGAAVRDETRLDDRMGACMNAFMHAHAVRLSPVAMPS